jgi:hypothetical protein
VVDLEAVSPKHDEQTLIAEARTLFREGAKALSKNSSAALPNDVAAGLPGTA